MYKCRHRLQNSPFYRQKSGNRGFWSSFGARSWNGRTGQGRSRAARAPSSPRSPISRPRAKTRSKPPIFGFLAKEGAVLQSNVDTEFSIIASQPQDKESKWVIVLHLSYCDHVTWKRKKKSRASLARIRTSLSCSIWQISKVSLVFLYDQIDRILLFDFTIWRSINNQELL